MTEFIDLDLSLGEFVAKFPKARKVFDKFGFDYCCGGKQTIKSACQEKKIDINKLKFALEEAMNKIDEKADEKIWIEEPLVEIVKHIVSTHHAFLRKELPYTEKLFDKVVMVHGPKHGYFLNKLQEIYLEFKQKLEKHLDEEEIQLFPYVKDLQESKNQDSLVSTAFVELIELLIEDHEAAGEYLQDMRDITSDYVLPNDACETFKTLYETMQQIEDDMHVHIHLENTILFPRIKDLLGNNK